MQTTATTAIDTAFVSFDTALHTCCLQMECASEVERAKTAVATAERELQLARDDTASALATIVILTYERDEQQQRAEDAEEQVKRSHRRAVHSACSFTTNSTEPPTPSTSSGSVSDFVSDNSTSSSGKYSSIKAYKDSSSSGGLCIMTNLPRSSTYELAGESAADSTGDVSNDLTDAARANLGSQRS
jgi:hypothetical protein